MKIGNHEILESYTREMSLQLLEAVLKDTEGKLPVMTDAEYLFVNGEVMSEAAIRGKYDALIEKYNAASVVYEVKLKPGEKEDHEERVSIMEKMIYDDTEIGGKVCIITNRFEDAIAMLCECVRENVSGVLIYQDDKRDLAEVISEVNSCVGWYKYFKEWEM